MKNLISESTLMPISLIIVVIGGVFWLGELGAETRANAVEINKLQEQYNRILTSIDQRLSFIEGKLSVDQSKR